MRPRMSWMEGKHAWLLGAFLRFVAIIGSLILTIWLTFSILNFIHAHNPDARFIDMLSYKAELAGMAVQVQEESYMAAFE